MKHLLTALVVLLTTPLVADEIILSDEQIDQVLLHGPWPTITTNDPSNRVSGNPDAITFGENLFSSIDLSKSKTVSCATCHQADKGFSDGETVAAGARILPRNTLTLTNMRFSRWFGWDGSTDSLWAQNMLPLLHSEEMNMTPVRIKATVMQTSFHDEYTLIFGIPDQHSPTDVTVNISKTLAAYIETLVTPQTKFDQFRDALAEKDLTTAATYPVAAQRGLAFFVGDGKCSFCHSGPLFTNGEFHDAGVGYFLDGGGVDEGRYRGLTRLRLSAFNLDGAYNDDPEKSGAWAVRNVLSLHSDFGTFRVPSLRNVENTAPYMHNGSLATLSDVIEHYSSIDLERLHTDGEAILTPLMLSKDQASDLLAFLKTLSN